MSTGVVLVEAAFGHALLQRQVLAVFMQVRVQHLAAVRAGDHAQAAVGAGADGSSATHTVQVASGRIGQ
jgi:hypothetical protein